MQVRQLLPNKEMRVEMKSLGLPPAEDGGRVRGAVVSSGGGVVNWVEESVSKDRKGKENSKSKKMRLLEALESSSDEEVEVKKRSGVKLKKGKKSLEESDRLGNEPEMINDKQMEKTEEVVEKTQVNEQKVERVF